MVIIIPFVPFRNKSETFNLEGYFFSITIATIKLIIFKQQQQTPYLGSLEGPYPQEGLGVV